MCITDYSQEQDQDKNQLGKKTNLYPILKSCPNCKYIAKLKQVGTWNWLSYTSRDSGWRYTDLRTNATPMSYYTLKRGIDTIRHYNEIQGYRIYKVLKL